MRLIVYDDGGVPEKSVSAVHKLIAQDNVSVIIGPSLSGPSLAAASFAESHRIPLISCGLDRRITRVGGAKKPLHWVFKTSPTNEMAVKAIITYMKRRGINEIAIMNPTTPFGRSSSQGLFELARKYGIEVVARESYSPQDTEMTAQLTKIRNLAPQAIVNWSVGPSQVALLRSWRELDMSHISIYQSLFFGGSGNIKLADGAAEGVYSPQGAWGVAEKLHTCNPQKEIAIQYLENYKSFYNEPISFYGSIAWDAFKLSIEAISEVGGDQYMIRDYLENKRNFAGQNGIFSFSPEDHNGLSKDSFYITVVKDGKWSLAE
jgi:branched-chain amino acid transport system substrate-binding protein